MTAEHSSSTRLPNATKGLLLMLLSTVVLASMHGMVRHLGGDLHPFVIAFYRNLFGLAAVLPLVFRIGLKGLQTTRPLLNILRSVSGIVAMLTWFYGLATVPTAEATALSFTAAIFSALAAFVFLGEKMRLRRWLAIGGGFAGVIVVLQPASDNFNPNMFLVVLSCVFWGLSVTIVKSLTRTDSSTSIVAWMAILLTAMSLPPALVFWQWPDTPQLLLLVLMGTLGTLGHLWMVKALSLADTTAVMSIDFMRLIWAALIGFMFYGDPFEMNTWIGAVIIFASGLYLIFRESLLKEK
jgi:drug/metabolite transporter (DMT)-like permease